MRILITGGCGFIGQNLARALSAHELVALDSLHPQVHHDPELSRDAFPGEVIVADVADETVWHSLDGFDQVVHLAAETGTAQSMYEADRYHTANVVGTKNAAEFAARLAIPLISMSSRAVYGEGRYRLPDGTVHFGACDEPDAVPESSREDDPHRPVSVYGETKSQAEEATVGDAVTILRPQNVIGAGQSLHNPYTGVLAAFLARLREGLPLVVYGDGTQTRDFVHVSDLVAAITWAIDQPATQRRVLNYGSGRRITLLDLARFAIAGSPRDEVPIEHLDVVRSGDIVHACADLSHALDLGVPAPTWTPEKAVADFIHWGWGHPGAAAATWDAALDELADRGLTKGGK